MPAGAEDIRVSAHELPASPEPAKAPKVEQVKAPANSCPPGYEKIVGAAPAWALRSPGYTRVTAPSEAEATSFQYLAKTPLL